MIQERYRVEVSIFDELIKKHIPFFRRFKTVKWTAWREGKKVGSGRAVSQEAADNEANLILNETREKVK